MSPITTHPQSSCNLTSSQDGVCGCPSFWSPSTTTRTTTPSPPPTQEASTPPGSPRETCFFWYHNTCRRGAQCQLAHEVHVTWPIPVPPRYVHYEKCKLGMCPLRWDLVAFKKGGGGKETKAVEKRGIDMEKGGEVDVLEGLIDPSSRAMDGEYSESGSEVSAYSPRENSTLCSTETIDRALPSPPASNHEPPLSRPRTMSKRKRVPSLTKRTMASPISSSTPSGPCIPTGPRSSLVRTVPARPGADKQICFNWYHSQPCPRQRKNKCTYTHYISKHGGEVSLPLGIRAHKGCVLELCPLRSVPAEKVVEVASVPKAPKAARVEEVEQVNIVGRGGKSWLEKRGRTGGETEQEIMEMRRRIKSDARDRRERRRLEKKSKEGRLDYGDEVEGKQEVDIKKSKSSRVSRRDLSMRKKEQPRVLVDYELPEGEERLEWDTDLVRRIFGEIE
ncbi:hypothetical protein HBH69_192750 [Parastagonospora nodorum]|nr:hypothetical protein HBH51_183730 [Parastagonospora nodorum]KAH3992529.1 hypothetical protein HBI10_214580 [Parastagonospora nodorum]KAH4010521.1 hypothetical protein HBI13_208940 [Parastagonospora nodorum]KAH4156477.1 hypothetical protein HBH43_208220 [Parastagonospora nodorum]KAH4198272.1 hypothetical protein HBI95_180580 [Parastagonospora nodorum]